MDQFIKSTLHEHYANVLKTLETYRGAIEAIMQELNEKETISGTVVREYIKTFEEENGLPTRLQPLKESKSDKEEDDKEL
jgi:cell division protease FtsH